jgi:hypothetical protein
MWTTVETEEYQKQSKWFAKKRKKNLESVVGNLNKMITALNNGGKLNPPVLGFIKSEPGGFYRIAESGSGTAATRLYFCADESSETVYLLTIGDKNTQGGDIEDCKRWTGELRAMLETKGGDDGDQEQAEQIDDQNN